MERDEVGGKDPGDDTVVGRVYAHWVREVRDVTRAPEGDRARAHVHRQDGGAWELAFSLDRGPGKRQVHFVCVDPDAVREDRWPLLQLAPGVWDLPRSVHVPGQFHGFVTLLGVPEPAPWQRGR